MRKGKSQDLWGQRYDRLQKRVGRAVPGECHVTYSAYPQDRDGLPVDNLDQRAVEGCCRVIQDSYQSAVITNPTWLQLYVLANEMIRATGDQQHVFLEGVFEISKRKGVKFIGFNMGS